MNKNIGILVIISNLFFYIGIISMIYLFKIDDNSFNWLLSIFIVVVGIVGTTIPDTLINIGIENISIFYERITIILKYIIFCILNMFLVYNMNLVISIILFLGLVDLFYQIILIKQIFKSNITLKKYLTKISMFRIENNKDMSNYLFIKMFTIIFFINAYEKIELLITLVICIIIQFLLSEKLIKYKVTLSAKKKNKIRIVLWFVEFLMLFFAYLNYDMLTYGLWGTYYMIVTDLLYERKTAIIKITDN